MPRFRRYKYGLLIIGTVYAFASVARPVTNCFPSQKMAVSNLVFTPKARVSESDREVVFQRLRGIYAQEIAAAGGRLNLIEKDDFGFAAYAWRPPTGEYTVELFKGIRFHPLMTTDVYAMIACHEIGHHLGGLPLKSDSSWAAVEGEADYFANLKCLRRYYEALPAPTANTPPLDLLDRCKRSFTGDLETRACVYALETTRGLGSILVDLEGAAPLTTKMSFEIIDATHVTVTLDSHPPTACRFDTYRAGALCAVPWTEALSLTDPRAGACHPLRQPEQARPGCWFAPPAGTVAAR